MSAESISIAARPARSAVMRVLEGAGLPTADLTEAHMGHFFPCDLGVPVEKAHLRSWIEDPQGVQWETFLTTGESTVYGTDPVNEQPKASCCGPRLLEHP